jgi:hypothetical protein
MWGARLLHAQLLGLLSCMWAVRLHVPFPGLAIYNAHLLEVSFPRVLYKKLMGQRPTFEDLKV